MAGPRTRALTERWHLLLTVWPSAEARDSGGWALRAATGTLSRTGAPLEVTVGASTVVYLPLLSPDTAVTETLSTAAQSFGAEVPWAWGDINPRDVDLSRGVGELARLWETSGGTALDNWRRREVLVSGDVTAFSWGDTLESVQVAIQDAELVDGGDFWEDGAELDADRFEDIANTGERDLAPLAAGYLPPIVYAPVGSTALAPMLCVVDEVDAVTGVSNLVPRRYLMGARRPASTGSAHQVYVAHPTKDGSFMAGASSEYQVTPAAGTDDLGGWYWYLAGDFDEAFGTASVDFANGSDAVTATLTGGRLAVGDQIKASTGGADDYLRIANIEGDAITLVGNYGGATSAAGTGNVIRTPPKRAHPAFRALTYGGDVFADRYGATNRPISAVVDVLIDVLRRVRMPLPLELGDIEALRPRIVGLDLTAVVMERQSPYGWALSRVLDWLPVRPYRDGGRIRFGWVGPVTEAEVQTEIDLDALSGIYRAEPISWVDAELYPASRVGYVWDVFRGAYRSSVVSDPTAPLTSGGARGQRVATGRGLAALADYGRPREGRYPVVAREYDSIESRTVAGIASTWLLYRYGMRRQGLALDASGEYGWMRPGCVFRATETGVTRRSQVWRVEMLTLSPAGDARIVAESVPS